jgi:hypothetical protein
MHPSLAGRRLLTRIAANVLAVISVTAIFALKASLDAREAPAATPPAQIAD